MTIVVRMKNWREDRVFFYTDQRELRSIPCAWTSLAPPDDFLTIAGNRALFRPDDLWRLAKLIKGVERCPRAGVSHEPKEV